MYCVQSLFFMKFENNVGYWCEKWQMFINFIKVDNLAVFFRFQENKCLSLHNTCIAGHGGCFKSIYLMFILEIWCLIIIQYIYIKCPFQDLYSSFSKAHVRSCASYMKQLMDIILIVYPFWGFWCPKFLVKSKLKQLTISIYFWL